jgi:hypothetical protein
MARRRSATLQFNHPGGGPSPGGFCCSCGGPSRRQPAPARAALPCPEALLPPPCHKPLLHAVLRRQGPLPLRSCDSLDPASWVQLLQRERLLLPAPFSLLVHSPWREAGLIALPPADPPWEDLWLVVRLEHLGAGWVEEVGAGVKEAVRT